MTEIKEPSTSAVDGSLSPLTGSADDTGRCRQRRLRRAAAQRVAPLDCGCRDPWPCRCSDPPLSEAALDGWAAAARHVLASGQVPLLPLEVRRALWRRAADRPLAERLHAACGEVVT